MTGHSLTRDFHSSEFLCSHCGRHGVRLYFAEYLQGLRDHLNQPIRITSGYRCEHHPIEARKSKPGRHTEGIAADISGPPLIQIWRALLHFDRFTGIGVALHQNYIHLDMRPLRQGRIVWAYDRHGNEVKWSGRWEELPK